MTKQSIDDMTDKTTYVWLNIGRICILPTSISTEVTRSHLSLRKIQNYFFQTNNNTDPFPRSWC